ncbi:SagB family peptide dehydrogenase [Microbacterium sp.]|uniref:SagB family peptide dehydrogenase n=1 Tax=Microbacterium sp. TaxID=51671 RepID=UPI0039E5C1C5
MTDQTEARLVRSPDLRIRPRGTTFVVDSPRLTTAYEVHGAGLDVLRLTAEPVSPEVLVDWLDLDRDTAARLVGSMVRSGLLIDATESVAPASPFDVWGQAVGVAHWEGERTAYAANEADENTVKAKVLSRTRPPMTNRRGDVTGNDVRLTAPEPLVRPLGEVLRSRRTSRFSQRRAVSLVDLSTLLGSVFGIISVRDAGDFGAGYLKAYPSAGALHDIDPYLVVFDVPGVAPGTYAYIDSRNCLVPVSDEADSAEWDRATASQGPPGACAMLLVLVSSTERLAWKYRSPRAYRDVWQHAGHATQCALLVNTALGLESFVTNAITTPEVSRLLGLTSTEWPTTVIAVNGGPTRS